MTALSRAITRGTWHGLCVGLHEGLGVLPPEAQLFLSHLPDTPKTPEEEGILAALIELRLVKREGWLWWGRWVSVKSSPEAS